MSGGRWRGNRGRRLARGLPPRVPWRRTQRILHHENLYHVNTASPGSSNAVTMHVTFNTPMIVIPPSEKYWNPDGTTLDPATYHWYNRNVDNQGGQGPWIWASNNTTLNAFRLTYRGSGNGTNCLQFTANMATQWSHIGNGDIRLAESSTTLINDVDYGGNQWILLPKAHPEWNANADVVYYQNTSDVFISGSLATGPNVAVTPSGELTYHKNAVELGFPAGWERGGGIYFLNNIAPKSAPDGYLWVANSAALPMPNQLPTSHDAHGATSANNLALYIYKCNTIFQNAITNFGGSYESHPSQIRELWTKETYFTGIFSVHVEQFDGKTMPSGWYRVSYPSTANASAVLGSNTSNSIWNTAGNAVVSNTAL
jgi:hypothetical protein